MQVAVCPRSIVLFARSLAAAAFFSYYSPAPPTNYNSKMRDLSSSSAFRSGRRDFMLLEHAGGQFPYTLIPRRAPLLSEQEI